MFSLNERQDGSHYWFRARQSGLAIAEAMAHQGAVNIFLSDINSSVVSGQPGTGEQYPNVAVRAA